MDTRYFHGQLTTDEIANALIARFDHGNLRAQKVGSGNNTVVQIATREFRSAGGQTAMAIHLSQNEDGVAVQIGEQEWLGIAASIGEAVLFSLHNPWHLISHLDDLAQDFTSLNLPDQVWEEIENVARSAGASFELSERLRRIICPYCLTANPVGEPSCIACGAPLGEGQPRTCRNCGFVVKSAESICPQCGTPL